MSDVLYVATKSKVRQSLLRDAGINFKVLEHTSDEEINGEELSFHEYVKELARHKMENVVLPKDVKSDQSFFVLTADTLMMTTKTKHILGKPKGEEDAKRMLSLEREEPIDVATGCCLELVAFEDGVWVTKQTKTWVTSSIIEFCVPDDRIDFYLKHAPLSLVACGAGIIEGAGASFLKRIEGSYSSALGLPLFEVCEQLKVMGFEF